ncbi:Epoxide hydrolase 2 [Quillaja saponaria]|uniref:Epoxide hydrolase 2 n=1 Tax=Quillaja saponaria TaxID=32244 RepID=A0AAD7QF96_QUISA|nr:Epoxide hydrolase 2 [Quillaja saponaria]
MDGIEHRTVNVNGRNIHIAEKGEGPLILFIHGFPELWYSWQHQILAVFSWLPMCCSGPPWLWGLGRANEDKVFVVGHDWGATHCLEPGDIEAEFAQIGAAGVIKEFLTYRNPGSTYLPKGKGFGHPTDTPLVLPSWLSEEEANYFAEKFEKTGFTGGLNYYRIPPLLFAEIGNSLLPGLVLKYKFLSSLWWVTDLTYNAPSIKDYIHKGGFKRDVPLLEEVVVMEGVGHFINQERPDEMNRHIYDFIQKF